MDVNDALWDVGGKARGEQESGVRLNRCVTPRSQDWGVATGDH